MIDGWMDGWMEVMNTWIDGVDEYMMDGVDEYMDGWMELMNT
jgi:hypothetical protein